MALFHSLLRVLASFLFLKCAFADITSVTTNCVTRTRGRSCANTVTAESSFTRTGRTTTTTVTSTPVVGTTNTFTRTYTSTSFVSTTITRDVTTSSVSDQTFVYQGATTTTTSTITGLTTITTIASSTTTIPTSPPFTPIASYVSGASSSATLVQRDLEKRQRSRPSPSGCVNTVQCLARTTVYPAVTRTVTAPTSTGVFYTSTFVTVTATVTYTYAYYTSTAYVFTTLTSTITTDVQTVFQYPTTTVTATPSVATVYAACQPNNIINRVNGVPVNGASYTAFDGVIGVVDGIYSAADCCAKCQQSAGCSGDLWISSDGIPGQCQLVGTPGVCNASAITQDFTIGYPGQLTLSNADCGKWLLQPNLQYVGSSQS